MLLAPPMIDTELRDTPSTSAQYRINAAFAFPSTGGAVIRIRTHSSSIAMTAFDEERGVRNIAITMPTACAFTGLGTIRLRCASDSTVTPQDPRYVA